MRARLVHANDALQLFFGRRNCWVVESVQACGDALVSFEARAVSSKRLQALLEQRTQLI